MKPLIVLGAGALLAASSFVAHAAPTVYGKVNVSLNRAEDVSGDKQWDVNSNASRLGFKGDQELTGDLKAIYKLEYQVQVDDGKGKEFKQRNIYGGLQHARFGTLIAGNFDTPLKASQGKVDQFGDLPVGDMKGVILGDERVSNIIQYSSPKIAGIANVHLAMIAGENKKDYDNDGSKDDGIADARSFAITFGDAKYKKMPYYAAIAYDNGVISDLDLDGGTNEYKAPTDAVRLTVGGKIGPVKLGALYQTAEETGDNPNNNKANGYLVSAAYGIGKATLKAQYASTDVESDDYDGMGTALDQSIDQQNLGVDYKLGKKTKVYGYVGRRDVVGDDEEKTLGLGFENKF